MAVLGKREIGLIEDALKDIYEQLTGDAVGFRKGILTSLIQGDNGSNYVTHTNALFDAFRKIEPVFEDLPLEKAIDFVKTSYDVLVETDQIADIDIPEMMWTGYDETANALEDIAIALNEKYDFDIDTTNIDNILVDMSEQLMGSDLKVGDIPEALEIQIRILDEMQYHEISQMYTAWTSTEDMRPMTIQLVEIYDQVDNLPDDVVTSLYTDFEDNLWITNEPNEYLLKYDNPEGLETKSVKNMIKYYFEQVGRLQEGYINFNGAEHAFLDGFNISNELDTPLVLRDNLKLLVRDNIDVLLPNSKEPYQFLYTIKDFEGVTGTLPFQVSKDYFNRYQEIVGKTLSDKVTDASYIRQEYGINQKMSLGEFSYQQQLTNMTGMDTSAYDAIPTNVVDDKLSTFDTTLNSADGNVEFYIKHQGTQVSANDIRYNPNLGSGTEKFIPGFYGEPVGDVSAETMGIKIQDNPVSNYYKVQVNTDNLLITQPDGFLGNQIDKVDWNIFAKETGISLSDIKNPKTQNVNSLINELKKLGLDDGTIAEGFRKSGIEGFVELKGNWREVVLIDPNDDLGIGSKLNIEDATEVEFLNNQSKVNKIDELVIKPTNVVDDVTPTQALDELDAAISKSDGIDNLNKAKKIINNNPGVFRKIFSVLEKADIGDQVITKAIIPKVLPRLGLATLTGPVGMAYAAYEMALLLSDVGQAAYKAQTTDESFWDNFGEISDKYSIAYKISKPVYDIILDSLNQDLTEEEDEEILFSFNR